MMSFRQTLYTVMLTDSQIRSTQYADKPLKLRDGNGLYIHILPSGKYFRYDYRFQGKRRTLSMGVYPKISLKQARIELFAAKDLIGRGVDPSREKQLSKRVVHGESFEAVFNDFIARKDWSERHRNSVRQRVEKDLIPAVGNMSVKSLGPRDFLYVLRKIEDRGSQETAHRVRTIASQVMKHAIYVGLIDSDPCRDLKGALNPVKHKRYPAIVKPEPFGILLKAISGYSRNAVIGHALKLLPHVVLRPSEIRGGLWSEIDIENRIWDIPDERMKVKRPHIVPLTNQSIAIIESLREITGGGELMFPSPQDSKRGQCISDGTLNSALRQIGYPGSVHVPHGFRSSFSTMAYESGLFVEDVIELQLSHVETNRVKGAYKRGDHLPQRKELMEWWSNRIDFMRTHAPVQQSNPR